MKNIERIPPHNDEAEKSVLGSVILDKDALIEAVEILKPDDFYSEMHKEIYSAVLELYKKNEPVDILTLAEELKKRKSLEIVGGRAYLALLSAAAPTTANVGQYAKIVEEKAVLRRLIQASSEIMEKSYQDKEDSNEVLDFAEQSIFDISQKKHRKGFASIKTVLWENLSKIDEISKNPGNMTGITTGFIDLDKKTSGLQKSDLIVLAARPSMGKTALALNIAQRTAIKSRAKVAIFSLEMSKEQLVQRMLSMEAKVEIQRIRTGDLDSGHWEKIHIALDSLSKTDIYIDDTPGISVLEMKNKCRRLKAEKGLDCIVIDYLQLMNVEGKVESRQQEISMISRSLKQLAREIDCPVIVLSQLSRAPDARSDHRPMLSDLRESGAIEQDADIVMFLYRDEYYNPDTEKRNICEVIIAKQRNGPTGTVELAWLGQYTKFADKA